MESQSPFEPQNPEQPTATESAWLAPAKLPQAYAAPAVGLTPIYDLRPLTTGEVLDRTFSVYRSRFWLFAGIASISGAVQLVAASAQTVLQHYTLRQSIQTGKLDAAGYIVVGVANLLFFLAFCVTQAATVYAVSEIYLGRTTTIAESVRATIGRWLAYVGIGFWQLGSFVWLPVLLVVPGFVMIRTIAKGDPVMAGIGALLVAVGMLGGGVGGFIFFLRNSMAVPAAVVESLKVRPSMRRSKVLAAGAKGKLFLVGLISWCLYLVVGVIQAPLAVVTLMALRKGHESLAAQAGSLLIGFLGHSVVTPVAMIGFTLVYFDQRVRKEAFDIAVLLGNDVDAVPVVVVSEVVEGPGGDGIVL